MKQWIKAFILTAIVAAVAIAGGCKKKPKTEATPVTGTMQIKINATYGGGYFAVSEGSIDTFNIDPANLYIQVETLQFFLSHIYLIGSDTMVKLSDVSFFDLGNPTTLTLTVPNVPQGNFTGIVFNCGVDSLMDTISPVASTCPYQLSYGAAEGLHWPMLNYVFEFMQGKWGTGFTDSTNVTGGSGFAYHIGGNQFYRGPVTLSSSFSVCCNETTTKTLTLDVKKIFYNGNTEILNVNTQGYSMSSPDSADEVQVANLFSTNFSQAFSLQ